MSTTRQRKGKKSPHKKTASEGSAPAWLEDDVDDFTTNNGDTTPKVDKTTPAIQEAPKKTSGPLFNVKLAGLQAWLDNLPEWPWMPLIVFVIAMFTRFWRLFNPPAVVFDEHHFGRFTNQYNAGTYFFDIHPPLGKWGFLIAGWLTGYEYQYCDYTHLGTAYDLERCKFMPLRRTAALFGALAVPLMYCITRRMGGGKWAALLAAAFFNWDMLNLIESRLILTDSQLMFWMILCLHTGMQYFNRVQEHWAALQRRKGRKDVETYRVWDWNAPAREARIMELEDRIFWAIVVGVACGASVSVKWTGLATPGLVAVECWTAAFFLPDSIHILDMLGMLFSALVFYASHFYIHFKLLPRTGDGDAFMSLEFQRTLVNNSNYDPTAPQVPFLTKFWQLNKEMLLGNARIDQSHNWESKWYTWPVNSRGVLYYSNTIDKTKGLTESVYLVGNPAVIWGVLFLLGMAALYAFLYCRYRNVEVIRKLLFKDRKGIESYFRAVAFCFTCYSLNLIPYIPVTRSCFVYHYMPALLYGEILAALTVERWCGRFTPLVAKYILAVVIIVFIYYMPWVYSIALTAEGHERRRWLPGWN